MDRLPCERNGTAGSLLEPSDDIVRGVEVVCN